MKQNIDFNGYDTLLQPTDWRYAAAEVGLVKYLDFHRIKYTYLNNVGEPPSDTILGFDGVLYNSADITEERFLLFVEHFFENYMTHLSILRLLEDTDLDEEKYKAVNDLVKGKSVLKNVLKNTRYDGSNKDFFINAINENRLTIIREIFRNGKNLYANFANPNLLLKEQQSHCRLAGYNVDEGRKTRFLGFCFSKDSFIGNDISEFDFIPFAFSNSDMYETYFVNNNFSMKDLIATNEWLSAELRSCESNDSKDKLLTVLKNSDSFFSYDVEIITKSRDEDFYKTLFVRRERLELLKDLSKKAVNFKYKFTDNYWLNLEREVYERCLNNVYLDDLILLMFRIYFQLDDNRTLARLRTDTLIDINQSWKGNKIMDEIKSARKMGFLVSQQLIEQKKGNKINAYKQKIIGALTAHDYDRVKEVILSLSAYVGIEFSFFYAFLEDAEENKDIAMAFASALHDKSKENNYKEN
ncbi:MULTISPECIES: type I CRISPR-associated protein Cas8a1/Csx8 [unclassified Ruminococcus]|uniref:type I CRISPR-associated protein Cas8a1/Csx8 n=1 Tax=unclassified Ruminococcus TaxID=2608920 RepID=UPI00210BC418|nr:MULTISPECIES: type I CRISPR-associated protein Cas8a1/Csx8 [unclassified Ruminococcus]